MALPVWGRKSKIIAELGMEACSDLSIAPPYREGRTKLCRSVFLECLGTWTAGRGDLVPV